MRRTGETKLFVLMSWPGWFGGRGFPDVTATPERGPRAASSGWWRGAAKPREGWGVRAQERMDNMRSNGYTILAHKYGAAAKEKRVGRLFYYGRRAPRCRGRSGLRTPGTRLAGTRIVGTGFEWRFGAAQAPRCGRFAHHATHFRCPAKEGDNPGAHAEKSGGRAQCGATRGRLECCSFGDLGPRRTRGRLSQHVRLRHHPAAEQWRQQQQP